MDIIRHHFNTIISTNTWGKEHAHEFPRDKITLITADEQTGGRGRFNRRWESPANQNIYASFCFLIDKERKDTGNIPQVLALSTTKVLQKMSFRPELKWPNDILLSKKKVAGILAETVSFPEGMWMIAGIGVNINLSSDYLNKIDRPATSLYLEKHQNFDIEDVLLQLQKEFCNDLELFFKKGFAHFLPLYRQCCHADSKQLIRFHDNRQIWEGHLHSINEDGSLSLELPSGQIKTFVAGEILFANE